MKISEIFKKDIARPINGVIKADQMDQESVWQELDEFVVTKELREHLRKLFARYCTTLDSKDSATLSSENGVWVSGFFGSGKSHFIKVLFHLLENEKHTHIDVKTQQEETKKAVDFFEDKIDDTLTFADIKRAVTFKTDVILFNIDSKANDRDAQKYNVVLAVFLKVLNQKLGYSPDHFHIAHLERYLDEKGKYQEFQNVFKKNSGKDWEKERDGYEFNRDGVIETFATVLGQSQEASTKWFDNAEDNFFNLLTVENFAKWTKEYLDKQGKNHRIVFLADEVGQFIGTDANLMLNLQTIVEQLGTVCNGRAWVVVTSQEDIDTVVQTGIETRKDFSKIQGRFKTRLNLSSRNVDEVIQERLLRKQDDNQNVTKTLSQLYHEKGDILRNQLSFKDCSFTWGEFKDENDFVQAYPFVPYQFKLLQHIFESIRRTGVAGIHLAQGERSLLDAFQLAAKTVKDKDVGVLVPLYLFFPAIESFLESPIKRAFDHAGGVKKFDPFDMDILRVLFLIRRVDTMTGNIDNLVTLCLDQVDADRVELKRRIEASLEKLERESLIKVSNGVYSFLTNEEQDVRREIRSITVTTEEKSKETGKIIFEEIFHDRRKHKHNTKKDFLFNRQCDSYLVDRRVEKTALLVFVISPFYNDDQYENDHRCLGQSIESEGKILIRLSKNSQFSRELQNYISIKKYVNNRNSTNISESTDQILQSLDSENQLHKKSIYNLLTEMLAKADYFIAGQKISFNSLTPEKALEEAINKFIDYKYDKLSLLEKHENPQQEIHAILFRDDVVTLKLDLPENNPLALEKVRQYIKLSTTQNKEINLYDACYNRFSEPPYGWLEIDTALLFVRLYAAREIDFIVDGNITNNRDELDKILSDSKKWQRIRIIPKETTNPETLTKAQKLGRSLFAAIGPDSEEDLYKFLKERLDKRQEQLKSFASQIANGQYPGKKVIDEFISIVDKMLQFNENETRRFFEKFNEQCENLLQLNEKYNDISNFFERQKTIWDNMLKKLPELQQNRRQLEKDNKLIKDAFEELYKIKDESEPYSNIRKIPELLNEIDKENTKLLEESRNQSINTITQFHNTVIKGLNSTHFKNTNIVLNQALQSMLEQIPKMTSVSEIIVAVQDTIKDIGKIKDTSSKSKTIRPADLLTKPYLETKTDIEEFLKTLRDEMEKAINNNERITIQ